MFQPLGPSMLILSDFNKAEDISMMAAIAGAKQFLQHILCQGKLRVLLQFSKILLTISVIAWNSWRMQ